jgi:hypothetical protein
LIKIFLRIGARQERGDLDFVAIGATGFGAFGAEGKRDGFSARDEDELFDLARDAAGEHEREQDEEQAVEARGSAHVINVGKRGERGKRAVQG